MPILSKIFKNVKQKSKKKYTVVQQVSFDDLAGKTIRFEIRKNGNNNLLSIKVDNENQTEIQLDQEKSVLFSILLQSFAAHEVFPDLDENSEMENQ